MPAITFEQPAFSPRQAEAMARDLYGITATAQPLPSERDQNFVVATTAGERFVLKIANAGEERGTLDLQNAALLHVAAEDAELVLPRVRPSVGGRSIETVKDDRGTPYLVRLLTWVDGTVMAQASPHLAPLVDSLGRWLGRLDAALQSFSHPAADRDLKWDPRRAGWIAEHVDDVEDPVRRDLVTRTFAWASGEIARLAPFLRASVIYNDANDFNVLVTPDDPYASRVVSVVDFGDMLRTWTVNDVAVACAYAALDKADPLSTVRGLAAGYHSAYPLSEAEAEAIYPLLCSRLCVSVVNAAIQRRAAPENAYLLVSERPAWDALARLATIDPGFARAAMRHACGFEPCAGNPQVVAWLRAAGDQIGPIVEPDPRTSRVAVLDLGVGSADAGTPDIWTKASLFSPHVFRQMARAGATVGVGRYDEVRGCYASRTFAVPGNDGPEWRTVHLGADLFAEVGTPVLAPLDGHVVSVANNAGDFDYGPTVILEHQAGVDGPGFYTLYGHLSWDSVAGLKPGESIAKGGAFAAIGSTDENGGWPPHVHVQIVLDLLGRHGDFPGVARPSEREIWLGLCPDPNLLLGLPGGITAPRARAAGALLDSRREHVGPSLSVSYARPLSIVRGWMQHLYDSDGQAYLDGVNNVPHVGHCHPHVVEGGQRQMAVLNTNTRYLHERLAEYAARLCATLPDPLRVCYFVNSGSEANELALRLARAATGSRETVVVDVGYHGNTTTLVDISPYKFDGPGGRGAAPWVHKVPTPDTYQGLYQGSDGDPGARYAAHVEEAVEQLGARGARPGAFIAESILSCAGQIVLPPNYLVHAYRAIREAGGVCIADEVQVGFGRAGSHFWAFQTQGVVPDVVTLGKPIGNGHPLGAVITTPAIARAFTNGMEYFNTFGGNPVSCAIGMAVMDVIERERLQDHARTVGARLLGGLHALMESHAAVGDVRGLGLFVGVELVRDRATREPDGRLAGLVANRMRDRAVLVSTDGPHHNVIKIKPPLVFTETDADTLVDAMDAALRELRSCVTRG